MENFNVLEVTSWEMFDRETGEVLWSHQCEKSDWTCAEIELTPDLEEEILEETMKETWESI